jgi:hypothetical protein
LERLSVGTTARIFLADCDQPHGVEHGDTIHFAGSASMLPAWIAFTHTLPVMSVQELRTVSGGAEWWDKNAQGLPLIFNLSQGSNSIKLLHDLLWKKPKTTDP